CTDFLHPSSELHRTAGILPSQKLQTQREVSIITQNVDGLHQRSGSNNVYELHGTVYQSSRLWMTKVVQIKPEEFRGIIGRLDELAGRPCNILNIIRALAPMVRFGVRGIWLPNLVLFGQQLPRYIWNKALATIERSDCFVVVGTSLAVYPAASLVLLAK